MGNYLVGFFLGFALCAVIVALMPTHMTTVRPGRDRGLWCVYQGSVYTLHLVDLEKEETK